MQGTIVSWDISTGCIKSSCISRASGLFLHLMLTPEASFHAPHDRNTAWLFWKHLHSLFSEGPFAVMRSTLMFLFFRRAQSCVREISVEPPKKTKPALSVSASCLNVNFTLQSTRQTWAARWTRETFLGCPLDAYYMGSFFLLNHFYRTQKPIGNKIMAIYPFPSFY